MNHAALLASLLLAACLSEGIEEQPADPTTPIGATVLSAVTGQHKPLIATGGALALRIEDKRALGLQGNASQGFAVTPYETDIWPHISSDYLVHAKVSGYGSYEIVTSQGIATGMVRSAPVARVELRPVRYELAGVAFALAPDRTQVEVVLRDAQGDQLVDAMLAIAGATQTDWDRASLPATPGRHAVVVGADSLAGEHAFEVAVVDGVDRVERTRIGDRTCFHAYAGDVEVVIAMSFERGTQDPNAANCATATAQATPDDIRVRF